MSEITMNLLDAECSLHTRIHGSVGDTIVAALAADPETITELERAIGRYQPISESRGFFEDWNAGTCDEPWDAGIVYIDLAGRLVVSHSSYSELSSHGSVGWHDGESATTWRLPYSLAHDWMFSEAVAEWPGFLQQRRRLREENPPIDTRHVLYEALPEYLVEEVQSRRGGCDLRDEDALDQLVREIHVAWMMTPREELRGDTPRDVLLARQSHIDSDLQNQGHRWSCLREPPPCLDRDSAAYRFAGFGTHEIVMYYDLVRYLLWECVHNLLEVPVGRRSDPAPSGRERERPGPAYRPAIKRRDAEGLIEHLRQLSQEWLHSPQDDLHGRSAANVIDLERSRLPMTVTNDEAELDHDCPLCQMMADDKFGPTFWHLDGCNMDEEFAFSFHSSPEEWEMEQAHWEDFSRDFEAKRKRDREFIDGKTELDTFLDVESPTWTSSYSNAEAIASASPAEAVPLMLFGIGAHLGELSEQLKAFQDESAKKLRGHFVGIRHAIDDRNPWLAESASARFAEELQAVGKTRPRLARKCADLESQVDRLLQRCRQLPDFADDVTL